MKRRDAGLTDIRGFAFPPEMRAISSDSSWRRGRREKHPIIPCVVGNMSEKPWVPNESAHFRARETWETLHDTHKRPSNLDINSQARAAYSIRFVLAGDLASAWKTIGGISAQFTHLDAALSIATLGNSTIATTHDTKIPTYANELSKFRERGSGIIALLTNEDQRIKRETLRDCGFPPNIHPRP